MKSGFRAAVRKAAGDVPPAAVLKELVRLGLARQKTKSGVRHVVLSGVGQKIVNNNGIKLTEALSGLLQAANDKRNDGAARTYIHELQIDSEQMALLFGRDVQAKSRAFFESIGSDHQITSRKNSGKLLTFKIALLHWIDTR
jgi:hypothetical protein